MVPPLAHLVAQLMLTIIGCGNLNRSDDGVGVVVAHRLGEYVQRRGRVDVSVFEGPLRSNGLEKRSELAERTTSVQPGDVQYGLLRNPEAALTPHDDSKLVARDRLAHLVEPASVRSHDDRRTRREVLVGILPRYGNGYGRRRQNR